MGRIKGWNRVDSLTWKHVDGGLLKVSVVQFRVGRNKYSVTFEKKGMEYRVLGVLWHDTKADAVAVATAWMKTYPDLQAFTNFSFTNFSISRRKR